MVTLPPVVEEFGGRLAALRWVSDLLVAGSLATGDYIPRISDLDLVALADGPIGTARQATLVTLHRHLDEGTGSGLKLGCVYVDTAKISDIQMKHPTWTHGLLVHRILSGITRAELRGRHALANGELLSKTLAVEQADAPAWLVSQLRARRRGDNVTSPLLRTALIAWRDARRTVARARAAT